MFSELKNTKQQSINTFADDKLNRGNFVNYVSNIIKNTSTDKKAFTIAINGKWGEGKTSTKNLIIERLLNRSKKTSDVLLEFSSTNFQNQKDLNKLFLSNLENVISGKNKERGFTGLLRKNKRKILTLAFGVLLVMGIIYPNIIVRLFSLILSFLFVFKTQLKKVTLSVLMDVAAKSYIKVDVVHRILYYNELRDYDFTRLKLKKYLETKCPYDKIIIFIDNFDLLEPNQIKLLMQFIADSGNLHKFLFVLFYDKNIISTSLTTNFYKGTDFIEHCVNIQLDLPPITDELLVSFLQKELQERYNINIGFFNSFKYVKCYFTSLIKIYSFLDNFGINYILATKNLVKNNFNFDKKDFFFLEVLRFFENNLYREIRINKRLLTKNELKARTEYSIFVPKIKQLIKNNTEENILHLLFDIFPYFAKEYNNLETFNETILRDNASVGHFDYFDYYFLYDSNGTIISEYDFNNLCEYLNDSEEFINNFNKTLLADPHCNKYKIVEGFFFKLSYRIDSVNLQKVFGKEFLKNIIWLYIHSGLYNNKNTKYLIRILTECLVYNTLQDIVDLFCSIMDERDYFNYFYVVKMLSLIKFSLFDICKSAEDIDVYKNYLDNVLYRYVDLLVKDEEFLKYLTINKFDSKLQLSNIFKYINEKIVMVQNDVFIHDNVVVDYFKCNSFKQFKERILGKYFNLFYSFCKYNTTKKVVNGEFVVSINLDAMYPLTLDEIVNAFKNNNISKKDKIFSLLLIVKKNNG